MAGGLPTSVSVAVEFTAGVWTDLGSRTNVLTIKRGEGQPGTLTFSLDNFDGAVTPGSPLGTYFPNMIEGKRVRVQVVKSAVTYTRFVGRLAKLTPVYGQTPSEDRVDVLATDLLGDLARMKMQPLVEQLITNGAIPSVQVAYPLTNPNGRPGTIDFLGDGVPLNVLIGGADGDITYNTLGDLGADGQRFAQVRGQKMLENRRAAFSIDPAGAGTPAITFALRVPESGQGTLLSVGRVSRKSNALLANTVRLYLSDLDGLSLSAGIVDSIGAEGFTGSLSVSPGWIVGALEWGGGNVTLRLSDGQSTSGGDSNTLLYQRLTLGNDDPIVTDLLELGFGYVIVNTGGAIEQLSHALLGDTAGYPFAVADALADFALAVDLTSLDGALALSSTPTTTRKATAVPYAGRAALDVLREIAASESGIVYHDYSGGATQTITVLARDDFRPITPAITLDVELDVDADSTLPEFDRGLAELVATATAKTVEQQVTATDTTLAPYVGTTGVDLPAILDDTHELRALAQDALSQARYSDLRVSSVSVDLVTAETDLYATAFAVTEGERVRLSNLSSTRFGRTQIDGFVSAHEEVITPESHVITWGLLAADAPPEARFDDSTYGRFGFGDGICTVTGGTAVGTTANGTITLTWTGSSTLSTAAGDWPCDLDWNGERVTVTAAPSGSTSPRTLTITARGVGGTVARVHAAGEPIDIWNAARFAL